MFKKIGLFFQGNKARSLINLIVEFESLIMPIKLKNKKLIVKVKKRVLVEFVRLHVASCFLHRVFFHGAL